MGSMAQDAIAFGLDPVIAPDGREWCDSSYGQSDASREIWGDLQDGCSNARSYVGNYDDCDEEEDQEAHSARVWKRKGYKVKYGETYAYKHYGNEIFTADQVKKARKGSYEKKEKHSSTHKKARSSEMHTYDAWLELGYQVRKGSSAVSRSGRVYLFDRAQVAWIG